MLRITAIKSPRHSVTLRLEGQIIDRWVRELSASCEQGLTNRGRLILDLIGVSFIDGDGLALMQRLLARDVSLVNPSPFVAELLKGAGL